MDKDAENVGETKKYSFLLGSAIRNEDPEQFLSIYDAIIPPDLPDIQIDYIKDKAREIADLPEEDFNNLVLNAREYSLAPDRKMSHTSFGARSAIVRQSEELSSEEDELVPSCKYAVVPPSVSPTDFCTKPFDEEQYNLEKRTDNDSGIYNSSKATTSIGSFPSDREDDSDGDDRRGIFDYTPVQSKPRARTTTTYRLDYDEAHDVEDSDKNSQCEIESPRSDVSCGTEMTTFRVLGNESDDFETDNDSDDNKREFIPHKRLYAHPSRKSNNYYSPMQRESTEDYSGYSVSSLSFDRSQKALHNKTASSLRSVDESVKFPLNGQRQSYGSTSSDRVRVEKSSYSRYFESPERGPPFGNDSDQFGKVASSIEHLINSSHSSQQFVTNMPEGRHISQSPEFGVDNNKKKKKKKKGSKDDLEDKVKKSDYDENGNPCLGESAPLLPTPGYKQMRESPHSALHGGSTTKPRFPVTHNGFPANLQQFDAYQLRGQQVKDLEEGNSTSQTSNHDSAAARKRLKKAKQKEKVIRAEEVENYVGEKNIDELLKFIENDGAAGTKKPNNKKVSASSEIVQTVKPADKNSKKGKDKRNRSTTNSKLLTDSGLSEFVIKTEDCELLEVISHQASTNTKIGETTMGNSSARASTEENGILTDEDDDVEVTVSKAVNLSKAIDGDMEEFDGDNKVNKVCTKDTKLVNKHIKCEARTKNDKHIDNDKGSEEGKISKKINNVTSTSQIITPGSNKRTDKAKVSGNNNNTDTKLCVINNSVKHNNTKNKGKADGCDTGKESNAVNASLPHVDGIHRNNFTLSTSKSPSVKDVASFIPADNYYIFTDLDLPPKEEEFKIVGKKKKQRVVIPPTAKDNSNTANFSKDTAQLPLRQPVTRTERPRKQVPRSVTPPPRNNLSTRDSVDVERLRDLSPSSFPALNSPTPSLGRDGRRNSTGDVPTEIVMKIQDDSDMESVKSLPASQGGCGTQQAVSPRMPVSYAKIAASPKPNNACLVGNKNSDDFDDSQENKEWKTAVWKGSPTERRHSIGSSPDNNVTKETDLSPSVRQKFGSQEVLVNSTSINDEKEQNVAVATSSNVHLHVSGMTNEVVDSKSEDIQSIVIDSACAPCVLSSNSIEKDPSVLNTSHLNVTDSSSEVISQSSLQPPPKEEHSVPQEVKQEEPIVHSVSVAPHESSPSDRKPDTKHVPPKQSANAARKNNKTKSVIFLDKRLNQVPKNLGITFGFELGADTSTNSIKELEGDGISFIANESCVTSVPPPQLEESSSGKNTIDPCCNSVIVSHSQMNPCTNTSSDSHCKPNPEFSKDSKALSHQHSLAGKNGVVLALKMPDVGESVDFLNSEQMSKFTVESTISCDMDLPKDNNPRPNLIVVCYGELTKSVSGSDDNVRCSKQVYFLPEQTVDRGRYNQDEAVSYIMREWERIVNLKDKTPDSVIVYNSQL